MSDIRGSGRAFRLRLSRADRQAHRTIPVELAGLAPCLPYFGLPVPA